jgi:rRNA biogenesis protein RRP5
LIVISSSHFADHLITWPPSDVTTNIESTYFLGQVIKTRLISVDLEQSRIVSSIRQVSRSSFQPQPDISSIELGNIVSGAIIAIQKDSNISLDLQGSQVRALLSLSNLATSRGHTVPQLRTSLKPGDILDDLVVVSKNPDKKIVIVAAKKNKPSNDGTSFGKIDHSISLNTLKIGQVVPGRIVSHGGRLGTSVRISNHIVGHVHPTDASDDYTSSSVFPSIQSIVDCAVLEVDQSKKRVLLSARRSLVHPEEESPVLDKEINGLDDLKFGDSVRGFVKSVAEHGLFVSVGRGIDARVQIRELFDEVRIRRSLLIKFCLIILSALLV